MYHYRAYRGESLILDSAKLGEESYDTPVQAHNAAWARHDHTKGGSLDDIVDTVIVYPYDDPKPITLDEAIGAAKELGFAPYANAVFPVASAHSRTVNNDVYERFMETERGPDQIAALTKILTYLHEQRHEIHKKTNDLAVQEENLQASNQDA